VTEYELVDGRELALTVLRSTGLISRNENPYREDPAGPEVPVPGAQLLGPWHDSFAVLPHTGSWSDADVLRAAERYRLGAVVAAATGPAHLPATATDGLRIGGDGVVLSALRRTGTGTGTGLELRLVAEWAEPTTATIELAGGIAGARTVDLLGREGAAIGIGADGRLEIPLGAWEIRTVRLERTPVG